MSIEDRAQEHEATVWAYNNRPRQSTPLLEPGDPNYGPELCAQCDDPMPTLRRRMGKWLCTPCQAREERRAAR